KIEFDGICGVPDAGNPLAKALQEHIYHAKKINKPVVTLKKETGGDSRRVIGVDKVQGLPRGSTVLLLDDLITKALSKFEAADVLEHAGFAVKDCLVFLNREQGGKAELQARGVDLHSIVGFSGMFLLYTE